MNKNFITLLFISLIISVVSYIALENIIISGGILIVYIIFSLLIISPMLKKHAIKIRKFHECYHFINNYVISLSIKKSIAGALESTVNSMPTQFIDIYEGLENMGNIDKLNYLSSYFSFHAYQLFLQILAIWQEEGGDILQMSKYLINEIRCNEEYITKTESMSVHKYVEIGILWSFCLLIIIVLRFALKDFYMYIKGQLIYLISMVILFLFILFTIFLLIQKGTNLKIKGYKDNEKNA